MAVFTGAGVAIITPMKENLEVDYDAFAAIIEEQIAGKTDAIVVCGTTGGKVVKIEGTGENTKATVEFRNTGTKQLLLKFAKFKIVG